MNVARAGHSGSDIRMDVEVTLTLDARRRFTLHSPVATMYGRRMREVAQATLQRLGIPEASLNLVDSGALDFTLQARLEAAAARLGIEVPFPETKPTTGGPCEHSRRTRLYVPGDTPKFMPHAGLYGADVLLFDLEDAVRGENKDQARYLVRHALLALDWGASEPWVRINEGHAELEIAFLMPAVHAGRLAGFFLPKCEDPERVGYLAALAASAQVILLLESPLGVLRAWELANSAPNIAGLAIGLEDYCRALGVERTQEGEESRWALGVLANVGAATGVPAYASVYSQVDDEPGLIAYARTMRALGFQGMGCIHPRQVAVARRSFAPASHEIAWAREVVQVFEEAQGAVVSCRGAMIDRPVFERARRILREVEQ